MSDQNSVDQLHAGTGFMLSLSEVIREYEQKGYRDNLVMKGDHFLARAKDEKITPDELHVDKVVRFDNTSDPDDQSILYAISVPEKNVKGLYVESYGPYIEKLSQGMIDALSVRAEEKIEKEALWPKAK